MDSDEFREITGVDGTNNNSPYQNDANSDDKVVEMENQDSNTDKISGVATEEDDKNAGVTAQEDNRTAEMAIHDRSENVDMAILDISTIPNTEHNSEHNINVHDAEIMMELNATNMNNRRPEATMMRKCQ